MALDRFSPGKGVQRIDTPPKEFLDTLEQNHDQISAEVREYYARNWSLIERVFPNKLRRLITEAKLRTAGSELEFRHRLLQLATDAKLDGIREKYDNWLRVVKVNFRQQFATYVTMQREELGRVIKERQENYLILSREKAALYEKYKDAPAAERFRQAMEAEDDRFFTWIDEILANFEHIVEEKIASAK